MDYNCIKEGERERERNGAPKSNVLKSGSPMANPKSGPDYSVFSMKYVIYIVVRMWRLYKTGIGLTTGFIRSHTVTHNYSVYTLQLRSSL
jgi:hypothetical protein